jgi:hypothetical protein
MRSGSAREATEVEGRPNRALVASGQCSTLKRRGRLGIVEALSLKQRVSATG